MAQRVSPAFLEWTERALSHSALAAYRCWLEINSPSVPSPPATTCLITPRKHEKPHGDWKTDAEQAEPSPEASEDDESEVGIAVSKTLVDETTVVNVFRAFHTFVSDLPGQSQPTRDTPSKGSYPQKDLERREVYRHYFRFLSLLLLPPDHPEYPTPRSLLSGSPTAENGSQISITPNSNCPTPTAFTAKAGSKSQLHADLKNIQGIYEAYLLQSLSFPKADEYHEPVGEFVDVMCSNWRAAGGSGIDAEGVVEILYRAATKTFHSPRILRHLFYALTSMGNLSDAVLALETYLDLSQNAKERIAKGKIEKDFDPDGVILMTAVDGIRVLCKHVSEGEKALKIAGRVEKWVREWRVKDPGVVGAVYRSIGTANATWARQTVLGEKREDILGFARGAFEESLKRDDGDVDAWYGLALVQADLLDVNGAIKSLNKALAALGPSSEERRRGASILYVLALLLSANEDFETATIHCDTALSLLKVQDATTLSVEEKELTLEIQMTIMSLLEATSGPESAVLAAEKLLTLYNRLFPPPLIPTISRTPTEPPLTATTIKTRPSTASRISKMFSSKPAYTREYSVSANDLPNAACLPPIARPGTSGTGKLIRPGTSAGSVRVRPKSNHPSLRNAPRIRVTHTDPDFIPPSLAEQQQLERGRRGVRRYSVSGGTIRRSKSVRSSITGTAGTGTGTPPLPSSTEISSPETSARVSFSLSRESVLGGTKDGQVDGVMFKMLKSKLQRVHGRNGTFTGANGSGSDSPVESLLEEKTTKTTKRKEIPSNLLHSQLQPPLVPLEDGQKRPVKRPWQLPEPVLKEAEERALGEEALRRVWLFVGGMYRRCGWVRDARSAIEEAAGVGEGEGEAEVYVERGLLAMAMGEAEVAEAMFESALAVDVACAGAIVGLAQVLLGVSVSDSSPQPLPPATTRKPTVPLKSVVEIVEEELMKSSKKARAMALLQGCTEGPRGWDMSEAWYVLAEVLERDGDVEGAKKALWRVVGLEDGRGVRMLGGGVRMRIL